MNSENKFNAKAQRREGRAGSPLSENFGLRWQSAAATPLWNTDQRCKSGVALRFPPHPKKFGCVAAR